MVLIFLDGKRLNLGPRISPFLGSDDPVPDHLVFGSLVRSALDGRAVAFIYYGVLEVCILFIWTTSPPSLAHACAELIVTIILSRHQSLAKRSNANASIHLPRRRLLGLDDHALSPRGLRALLCKYASPGPRRKSPRLCR